MKAYNSRKTCREHWLFKNKFRKLSLTNKDGGIGVFRVRKLKENKYTIFGDYYTVRYCFKELKKVLTGSNRGLSISNFIRIFERDFKVKIEDIGLTRQDFIIKDIKKIADALNKYKSLNIYSKGENRK